MTDLHDPAKDLPNDIFVGSQFCSSKSEEMRVTARWLCATNSLRTVVSNNLQYFENLSVAEGRKSRFYVCFSQLAEHLTSVEPLIKKLNQNASRYDFDKVPANGFRSVLSVVDACMCRLVQTARMVESQREDFLFRKNFHLRDLEEYTKVLGALRKMLIYCEHMMNQSDASTSLFPKEGSKLIDEWFREVETLNQEVFYGRSLGFQYCSSVNRALQTVTLAMAVCADTFRSWEKRKIGSAKLATTMPNLFTTTRFIMNPELRSRQIVHTTRNADINFCKQFWGLTEAGYLQSGFNWILPSVVTNEVIQIEEEILFVTSWPDGKEIPVKAPIHGKPVMVRLISDVAPSENPDEPRLSSSLLFHCHGGGFIAQSSKAHESYLLKWAKDLRIPILSIDYALAPEAPYPKGLDEVVFAYAWALKNAARLGWSGEKICFVGDSAGANLVVAATLKIFCKGLKVPDGILAAYGAFLVQYTPSPSRLLCLMDPLLPMGILTRCLAAYAGISEPTCVGQVQGADDKVTEQSSDGNVEAENISPEKMYNTSSSISSNHTEPDSVANSSQGASSDAVDGSLSRQTSFSSQRRSHWFGKGMANLFNSLRAKPVEAMNEVTDLEESSTHVDLLHRHGPTKVLPLPRFNFASVSVEDPFLSPLLAQDHILSGLPPVYLVACHLDPLLDDSISFARRLQQLKKPVHLDVMNHLPHGFLNFSLLSTEAAEATELCAKRIRQILKIDKEAPV